VTFEGQGWSRALYGSAISETVRNGDMVKIDM